MLHQSVPSRSPRSWRLSNSVPRLSALWTIVDKAEFYPGMVCLLNDPKADIGLIADAPLRIAKC